MGSLTSIRPLIHANLTGVKVFPLDPDKKPGVPQEVARSRRAGDRIPPHRHAVDAEMFIVGGSGDESFLTTQPSMSERSRSEALFALSATA